MPTRPLPSRKSVNLRNRLVAGTAATIAILSGPIQAATYDWDKGGADFLWGNPLNWNIDGVPIAGDTINLSNTTAGVFGDISLGNVERSVSIINFTANTADRYRLVAGGDLALGFLSGVTQINQTAADPNEVQVRVRAGDGTGVLTSNVTTDTLGLQQQITSGGLIKNGGATLRLGTSGTNFVNAINGNVVINGGTLSASGGLIDGSNNPLGGTGNVTIGAAGVTLALNFSNITGTAAPAGIYDFGRNIVANNNNFTLTVDRANGLANSGTSQAGLLTMGNATLTVNGNNGFNAQLDGLSVNSGATTILNINNNSGGAQNLRLDSLIGDATTTIRKDGGQTLLVSAANNAGFLGTFAANGGTIQLEGAPLGLSPAASSKGIIFTNSANVNLRAAEGHDFVIPISFAPGVVTSSISVDRLFGTTATNGALAFGDLNIGASGLPNGATRVLTMNGANGFTFAADSVTIGAGQVGALNTNSANGTTTVLSTGAGSIFEKRGGNTLTLATDNSSTSSGQIKVLAGVLEGNSVGAFGTGLVTVGDTAANSAGFINAASRVRFGASGASANTNGVDVVAIAAGVIDLNVTPDVTDVFEVRADGRIQGDAAQLGALTVGTNLFVSPNAIIVHDAPGASTATVGNLANNANLFYGIAATANSLPTIGVGTPWKGVSSDNTSRSVQGLDALTPALVNINGGDNNPATVEATFQGMLGGNLTFASDYQFVSTAAGQKVTLGIGGTLGTALGNVPGGLVLLNGDANANGLAASVDKIIVSGGGLSLSNVNALRLVPVEVQNNASLDIGNVAGNVIDGPVTLKSGGVFVFNDNQILAGSGVMTFESGSKLDITGAAPATFFTTASQPMNFDGNNYTVRFAANDVAELDLRIKDQGATFVVSGGAATATVPETNLSVTTNTQTAGLTLLDGVLTNDGTSRGFSGPLNLGSTLPSTVGTANLTVAASRGTAFVVTSAVETTGDVQIGSLTAIDGRDKSYNSGALNAFGTPDPYNSDTRVVFTGAFTADDVTVNRSALAFTNALTTINGNLVVNGGILYIDGGGPVAGTMGQLTGKLAAGTLADSITLGNYSRTEMKLILGDVAGAVLEVNQPFIIDGDVNPNDNRRMWVSRQSGTNDRVNLNDITLNAGSAFALDEDSTNIRASFKLAGNATIFRGQHDDFELINVTRAASLGTTPATLTLGRINVPGISGYQNSNHNVFGQIGEGVQVDIVRGQLFFQPGSSINGVIRTQTALAGGDSFIISTASNSNTNMLDSSIGGTGRIELGRSLAANGPEDLSIRGTETAAAGTSPLHTHAGEVRIVDDGTSAIDGVIRSDRANDSTNAARVRLQNLVLNSGATVQLENANAIPLTVGGVTLNGPGTIHTISGGMTIETINAGANAISFTGTTAPTVLNPLTAGKVTSANANFSGAVTATTDVNVSGGTSVFAGTVTAPVVNVNAGIARFNGAVASPSVVLENGGTGSFVGNVSGSVAVKGSAATFNPGVGAIQTVGGPVSLDTSGTVRVASGTLDLGNNAITSNNALPTMVAGLREQLIPGPGNAFNLTTPNTSNTVKLGPVMAQTTAGFGTDETYVYSGEFFVPETNVGAGTGTFAFAENFDDSVRIEIGGVQVLRNETWNDATGTGALTLPTGWHSIEIRLGQGGGGAGPNANDGWNTSLGLGLDISQPVDGSTGSPAIANFVAPLDNGSMNLFRATVQTEVSVAANSVLKASHVSNVGTLAFTGASGEVELSGTAASSATALRVAAGASGSLDLVNGAATATIKNLNLDGNFIKDGEGTLIVTDAGTGTGTVTVQNGTLGGGGTITGPVIALDGIISPGLGAGRLSVGGLDLQAPAVLQLQLDGATAGTGYDQILLSATNTAGVTLAGSLNATLGFVPTIGDVFLVILNGGTSSLTGTFSNAATDMGTVLVSGVPFTIDYGFNGNGDGQFNDVALIAQVPEPTSLLALLGGFGMLAGLQRFRRSAR